MRFIGLAIFLGALLAACDPDRVYEYNRDLKERNWRAADTLTFEFRIRDIGKKYNIYCNVRNSLDYPFARLFVMYAVRDSMGVQLQKNLTPSFLFDQKTGRPFGQSGIGDVYDHQFSLVRSYGFKRPGQYKVTLAQFMRADTLRGVLAVGVRVETAGEKK